MAPQVKSAAGARRRANTLVRRIARNRRAYRRDELKLEAGITALKARYGPGIDARKELDTQLTGELVATTEPWFDQLVKAGTAMIALFGAKYQHKKPSKPKLDMGGQSEDDVIEQLRAMGLLDKFATIKYELKKDALKEDPELMAKLGLSVDDTPNVVITLDTAQGDPLYKHNSISVPLPKED